MKTVQKQYLEVITESSVANLMYQKFIEVRGAIIYTRLRKSRIHEVLMLNLANALVTLLYLVKEKARYFTARYFAVQE